MEELIHPIFKQFKKIKLLGYSNRNTDYQKAKEAIVKWQTVESLNEEQIKECNNRGQWIGGAVPNGFIVVDVDSKEKGKVLYEGLLKAGYSFIAIETPNGYQFIFRDTGKVKNQGAKRLTLCGIVVDYRLAGKGYIVLPSTNTKNRMVIHEPDSELDIMPLFFLPVRGIKETDTELDIMPEGIRTATLISHASKIREWNVAHGLKLTIEEKRKVLDEINSILCDPPLTHDEIEKILQSAESYEVISTPLGVTEVTEVTVEQRITDNNLIPLCSFPFNAFPQKLLSVINRLSNALHVEPEIVASAMLTTTSGAIGNTIRISPKQGYEVSPFIWLIIIALSGYGKSPVIQTLLKHIKHLQAKNCQEYQKELKKYETQLRKAKSEPDAEIPEKPKLKHQFVSDCTVEALGNVFEDDGRGVIVYQDEIAGLILGLDQYKGKGNDRQHYLELFNCDIWKIDRKSGMKFIHNTGASIIGGIQPKVMPIIFKTDSFDDGFLPRFLLLNAENGQLRFSRQQITENDLLYWNGLLDKCYDIPLIHDDDGFVKPKVLILSSEALDVWEQFYNEYGSKIPFLSDRAKVFIPKLTSYYSLKFAGVLHVIEAFDRGATINNLIDAETINHAINLIHYFAGQAMRALRHYERDTLTEYQKRLIDVLYGLQDEVKNGMLPLSRIVDTFNEGVPEAIKHTPHKISAMFKELGLTTEKGSHNLSFLQWESEKIQRLFSITNVTKITKITPNDGLQTEKVTKVTDVTFNPEKPLYVDAEVD